MKYKKVCLEDKDEIANLSAFATKIVKQHFDPIIGAAQKVLQVKYFNLSNKKLLKKSCLQYFLM